MFVLTDAGREIQVVAGYRHVIPTIQEDKTSKDHKESSGTALFDVIEDVEEKPIPTPL